MKPLEGVRVLDLGLLVAGPMCSMYLAGLGADVVRVDRPGGDWTWTNTPQVDASGAQLSTHDEGSMSLGHLRRERGKRNVALDLSCEQGRKHLQALVERADVLVENRAPGALDRLGLVREEVLARHPQLIWCSIKGYGEGDPRRSDPTIDLAVQARSGLMFRTGDPDGPPQRAGNHIADGLAAIFAAFGVMGALAQRDKDGKGGVVEVSLLDVLMAALWDDPLELFAEMPGALRMGNKDVRGAPCNVYPTTDGYVALIATSPEHWRSVCEVIGTSELAEKYPLPMDRVKVRDEVDAAVAAWTKTVSSHQAEEAFTSRAVPAGAVLDPLAAVEIARARERGLMENLSVAGEASVPSRFQAARLPIWFNDRYLPLSPAQPLGYANDTIIKDGEVVWGL